MPNRFTFKQLSRCQWSDHTLKLTDYQDRIPAHTTGNGNCLYNAISNVMFGSEPSAMQIKLCTSIAMATRSQEIKALHGKHGFITVGFDYEGSVTSACTNGAFHVWLESRSMRMRADYSMRRKTIHACAVCRAAGESKSSHLIGRLVAHAQNCSAMYTTKRERERACACAMPRATYQCTNN